MFNFLGSLIGMCSMLVCLIAGGLVSSAFNYPWGDGVVFSVSAVAFSVLPRSPRLEFGLRVIFLSVLAGEGAISAVCGVRSGQIVVDGAVAVLLVIMVERFARESK